MKNSNNAKINSVLHILTIVNLGLPTRVYATSSSIRGSMDPYLGCFHALASNHHFHTILINLNILGEQRYRNPAP